MCPILFVKNGGIRLSETKRKMHTGELYLPGDAEIMAE